MTRGGVDPSLPWMHGWPPLGRQVLSLDSRFLSLLAAVRSHHISKHQTLPCPAHMVAGHQCHITEVDT